MPWPWARATGKKKSDCFTISPKYFTLKKDVSLRVLCLGLPMALGTVLSCVSGMFSNQLLVKYGDIAIAANGVAGKASMLVIMIVMGVCMGMQPVISYAFGMGDRKRLRKIVTATAVVTTIISTVLGGGSSWAGMRRARRRPRSVMKT